MKITFALNLTTSGKTCQVFENLAGLLQRLSESGLVFHELIREENSRDDVLKIFEEVHFDYIVFSHC